MNIISRQAVIGAFVTAVLVLGANASPDIQRSTASSGILTVAAQRSVNTLRERFGTVAAGVFDGALDLVGEFTARLKQM